MTLDFNTGKDIIVSYEKKKGKPYIGFIAPNGDYISFNILMGDRSFHDSPWNPVSYTFLDYISYIVRNTNVNTHFNWWNKIGEKDTRDKYYEFNHYPNIKELVLRGFNPFFDYNRSSISDFITKLDERISLSYGKHGYEMMVYDLLIFFRNAYANKTFFETIGKKFYVDSERDIIKKYNLDKRDVDKIRDTYKSYLKMQLLSYQKDIIVQYLGYDAIERFDQNGMRASTLAANKDSDKLFLFNPRVITSSCLNVYERYYNYLLMDWTIQRLPRYCYNYETKTYEIIDLFYQSEHEEKLKQEIQAIRKLVPLCERYKYFR